MRSAVCFSLPVETVPESSMVESLTFTFTLLLESSGSLFNLPWMVLCKLAVSVDAPAAPWSLAGRLPLLVWVPLAAAVLPAMLPAAYRRASSASPWSRSRRRSSWNAENVVSAPHSPVPSSGRVYAVPGSRS